MKATISYAALGFALAVLVTTAMSMSYDDALEQQAVYCTNVADGTWPDFNFNYDEVCND